MIKSTIFQYVLTLFNESRDGKLIAGDADNQFDCPVEWDEDTADMLAEQCGTLVAHLTELSRQYEKLKTDTRYLTKEQLEIWNTYLKPFPKHGLDMAVLEAIWEKIETGELVTEEEQTLADQYKHWFEENALARLPIKRCNPVQLINRARRYSKLIRLDAPAIVRESEAKRFAQEYVLYHCIKQNSSKKLE